MSVFDQDAAFFMVANAETQASIPVDYLTHPPVRVQPFEGMAEAEAVRLATLTGGRFFVLKAICYVEVVDGIPRWTNT